VAGDLSGQNSSRSERLTTPTECFNPNAAVMRAEALSRKEGNLGAIAFSRTGDPAKKGFQRRQGDQEVWQCAG
jgi:hypothetical protein